MSVELSKKPNGRFLIAGKLMGFSRYALSAGEARRMLLIQSHTK